MQCAALPRCTRKHQPVISPRIIEDSLKADVRRCLSMLMKRLLHEGGERVYYRDGCVCRNTATRESSSWRAFAVTIRINESRPLCNEGRDDEVPFRAFKVPLSSKDNAK